MIGVAAGIPVNHQPLCTRYDTLKSPKTQRISGLLSARPQNTFRMCLDLQSRRPHQRPRRFEQVIPRHYDLVPTLVTRPLAHPPP